jgi:hypothetical protein
MPRKKGSTASQAAQVSAWVLTQFQDNRGNWPARFAQNLIMAQFDLAERSARQYYSDGRKTYNASLGAEGGAVLSERERLNRALACLSAAEEALYLARQSDDSRQISAAIKAAISAEDQLTRLNPSAVFGSVADRRAAFREAKEAHLNDPPF